MNSFLADTNVISELMRKRPHPDLLRWSERQDLFYLSVITVEEIITGLERQQLQRKRQWFGKFLTGYAEILTINADIAIRAGEIRGRLWNQGVVRSQADILIAATAFVHNLPVATRNRKDFEGCGVPVLNPFDRMD